MQRSKPNILSENDFLTKVVPFFEDIISQLQAILSKSKAWKAFLSKLSLVYINNFSIGQPSYFRIGNNTNESKYLANSKPQDLLYYSCIHPGVLDDLVYIDMINCLRYVFIKELLSQATPQQLLEYLEWILNFNYKHVVSYPHKKFIYAQFININLLHDIFAIGMYKVHIFIPLVNGLDAEQVDIEGESEDDIKIVFSNRKNVEDYKNFHQVLGLERLTYHLSEISFVWAANLYKQILKKSHDDVFKIIDLLQTTSDYDLYEMKKDLIHLDVSQGKIFEDYLRRFLTRCFRLHFKDFVLDQQVPNRARILSEILLSQMIIVIPLSCRI